MRHPLLVYVLLTALLPLLTACDQPEVISLRVRLNADLSGDLLANVLAERTTAADLAGQGVDWRHGCTVILRRGRFGGLGERGFEVEGIRFTETDADVKGQRRLAIVLPLGEEGSWIDRLVPLSARSDLKACLDPDDRARSFGREIKFEIELPVDGRESETVRDRAGFSAALKGDVASLTIDLDEARKGRGEAVWIISFLEDDES